MSRIPEANAASRAALSKMHDIDRLRLLEKIHDVLWPQEPPFVAIYDTKAINDIVEIVSTAVTRQLEKE